MNARAWRAAAASMRREPRLRFNDVLLAGAVAAAEAVADELERTPPQHRLPLDKSRLVKENTK